MASEQQTPESIYFFGKSNRESKRFLVVVVGICLTGATAYMLALLLVVELERLLGFGRTQGFFALTVLLCGCACLYLVATWRYLRRFRDLPTQPEAGVRLVVVGLPQQINQCGELSDVPFEPAVFSAALAQRFSKPMRFVAITATFPAVVVAHYFCNYLAGKPFSDWSGGAFFTLWSGGILAVCFAVWLWPTYFRIVPGRLDVMRFNNLLNRPVAIEHYNLRTAKVLVDLRRGVIFVDEESGRTGEFPIVWMRRRTRERLAYHLLLAALSSYEAPELPDDKLLG